MRRETDGSCGLTLSTRSQFSRTRRIYRGHIMRSRVRRRRGGEGGKWDDGRDSKSRAINFPSTLSVRMGEGGEREGHFISRADNAYTYNITTRSLSPLRQHQQTAKHELHKCYTRTLVRVLRVHKSIRLLPRLRAPWKLSSTNANCPTINSRGIFCGMI